MLSVFVPQNVPHLAPSFCFKAPKGMLHILKGAIVLIGFIISVGANAATVITDTVTVEGREWAQVDLFTSLSWNEINVVCPGGACSENGVLNGFDMSGWTWGGVGDLNSLFNIYIGSPELGPGPDHHTQVGSLWAPAALADFRPTRFITAGPGVFGILSDSGHGADVALIANVGDYNSGNPDWIRTDNSTDRTLSVSSYGAWFYRPSEVPIPAAAWLFGSALLGLAGIKRKKRINK